MSIREPSSLDLIPDEQDPADDEWVRLQALIRREALRHRVQAVKRAMAAFRWHMDDGPRARTEYTRRCKARRRRARR